MSRKRVMQRIEEYRTAGGREEHAARKEELETMFDSIFHLIKELSEENEELKCKLEDRREVESLYFATRVLSEKCQQEQAKSEELHCKLENQKQWIAKLEEMEQNNNQANNILCKKMEDKQAVIEELLARLELKDEVIAELEMELNENVYDLTHTMIVNKELRELNV